MTEARFGPWPPLSAAELLDAWERASTSDALSRPLSLLATGPGRPAPTEFADLAIGERDAMLLRLRAGIFGSTVAATAACPSCGAAAELEFAVEDLVGADSPAGELSVTAGGYSVSFRLPTTADLASVPRDSGRSGAARHLLTRCVLSCRDADEAAVSLGELPEELVDKVADAMAAADPCADIEFAITCPACGASWMAPFDPVSFVWTEVDAWAQRTLTEVDALARAYGWPEAEVLALSPWRRRRYLDWAWACAATSNDS